MDKLTTTNRLLFIIIIPIIFYVLKTLSFIFIPLAFSMFISLMFLPFMRWLKKKNVPNGLRIPIIISIIVLIINICGKVIRLISKELVSADKSIVTNLQDKVITLIRGIEGFFGITATQDNSHLLWHYLQKLNFSGSIGFTLDFIGDTLSMTLMTLFFTILWLSESIDFHEMLNSTILRQRHTSVKVFRRIEKDLIKFVIVKIIISLGTGILFSLACLWFDVSFPVFWGMLAFLINFVQMIGSFIATGALSLFAIAELDSSGTVFVFIGVLIAIQVVMGSVLEPIFMGKSFSINVISILVMLMFWGYIWGIPGIIMAIPITVFIKIILEQNENTKLIAKLISGKENKLF